MASVGSKKSAAQRNLEIAIGKHHIDVGELRPAEFVGMLELALRDIDLRELRGFKPLSEILAGFRTDGNTHRPMPMEIQHLLFEKQLRVVSDDPEEPVDLTTHLLSVSRLFTNLEQLLVRNESGERTTDWRAAEAWRGNGYLAEATVDILFLRRPRNHSSAKDNLVIVRFKAEKIPNQPQHAIVWLQAHRIVLADFRKMMGTRYARIAVDMINYLNTAVHQTISALRSRAESMEQRNEPLNRLRYSITAS